MKRYLLFVGEFYYPCGGWEDFVGSFDSVEEARARATRCDWAHVIDATTGERVWDK